ncbi:uncharacterized protein SCHCODRAFT_02627708 [Schizophyllum commune H4-8]|uniref:uncharacterized protein n=1 Tax=Schizophyllum commune (strain H4-8 / FGSC 9210) TaxID=578458 RepID=UPI00215F7054|nr:uncharacterized protein SCHCODRAFT_02627708 [Schizophyllum commune H4-8]KAI5890946.1 hypothetical protein SCHCODRAFT_02627708 [Schizophyllum commune H4-8]
MIGKAIGAAGRAAYVHHRRSWAAPRVRLMFTVARHSFDNPLVNLPVPRHRLQ